MERKRDANGRFVKTKPNWEQMYIDAHKDADRFKQLYDRKCDELRKVNARLKWLEDALYFWQRIKYRKTF